VDLFNIGPMEFIVILVIALIFLGPAKLGEAGRYVGKAMKEIRKATTDLPKMITEEDEKKQKPTAENPEESVAYKKPASQGEFKSGERKNEPPEEDLP